MDCRVCGKQHGNYFYGAGATSGVWRFTTLDDLFAFVHADRANNRMFGCRDTIIQKANAADCWTKAEAPKGIFVNKRIKGEVCRP